MSPVHKTRLRKLRKWQTERELTIDETSELATLLAARGKPGRKKQSATEYSSETVYEAGSETTPNEPNSEHEPTSEPKRVRPPTPKPPKVEVVGGSAKDDWRGKYRQHVGREAACVEIAQVWCMTLKRLSKFVSDCGETPIFDDATIDDAIFPACVLTADKFLPAGVEPGPEVTVAIGSTLAIGQAFITARKRKKKKASEPKNDPSYSAYANGAGNGKPVDDPNVTTDGGEVIYERQATANLVTLKKVEKDKKDDLF